MKLQFTKTRKVKSPARANKWDAGIDFFIPEDISVDEFVAKQDNLSSPPSGYSVSPEGNVSSISLQPGDSVLIPSGIKVKVPEGYALIFNNKSGVASKKGLIFGASVVDCGYEGECHINLYNISNKAQVIEAGQKIIQGILMPVECCEMEEISSEKELYANSDSSRGDGGFGSTGTC